MSAGFGGVMPGRGSGRRQGRACQCPARIPGIGIPGGQGGCKVLSPQVMWLSLGLHPFGKDEVHGQSQLGHPKKQRRQTPELLIGGVSGTGVPALQAVEF